jgi:MarR family 2-MHQ and catechol resistance regulon transcriptional repressor
LFTDIHYTSESNTEILKGLTVSLQRDLNLRNPLRVLSHEAALSIVLSSEMLGKEADRLLRSHDLTSAQFDVLMLLKYQCGPDGLSQTELSRMLLVNRANVSGLVDRMERDGLIARVVEPGDRRVNRVRMTRKGSDLLQAAEGPYIQRVEEVLGVLSEKETRTLIRMLDRLRAALTEGRD